MSSDARFTFSVKASTSNSPDSIAATMASSSFSTGFIRDRLALMRETAFRLKHLANRAIQFLQQEEKQRNRQFAHVVKQRLQNEAHALLVNEQYIRMVSPENILKRGYTITMKTGKIVTSAAKLQPDDMIETLFWDGKIESQVKKSKE
jgi:exonuclease VII large subunit